MTDRRTASLGLAATVLLLATSGCAHADFVNAKPSNAKPSGRADVRKLVVQEARNMGVRPSLALAVAQVESNFNPRAESHVGARGVMQVMPATARGEYGIHPDYLWDARINIRIGLHFLRRLIVRYGGRRDLALSHYNGGSRVGKGAEARVIPATRGYVDKVLKLERQYRYRLSG